MLRCRQSGIWRKFDAHISVRSRFLRPGLCTQDDRRSGTHRRDHAARAEIPLLEQAGIKPLLFDGQTPSPELLDRLAQSTHVLISISPGESGDPAVAIVEEALRRSDNTIRWIGYLSTVGVYGDHQGAWVDETTACKPSSRRNLERVEAEKAWGQLSERHGTPLAILRLSGIYGPGRNAFVNLKRGTARRVIKENQIFNRIHVGDIAGSLRFLAGTDTGGIFNITDNEPSPRRMSSPTPPN